jgi:alpha-beta hydrolase superfamily lysophospholipase
MLSIKQVQVNYVAMNKKRLCSSVSGKSSIRRVLFFAVFAYICFAVYALVWSDRIIFQPPKASYADSSDIIKITAGDGCSISAIYMINLNAEYTILYSHGNAEDLGHNREFLNEYFDEGFSVFAYDYHGYGTSQGRPTTRNAYRDADAAMRHLVENAKVPLDRIILHGRSLGSGPSLYLAQKHNVAGVIIQSGFVTAFRVVTHIPLLPFDKFRNIARIHEVNCPVLIIHGQDDRIIPLWHGKMLFKKAKHPKSSLWLDGVGHNYFPPSAQSQCWESIHQFVKLIQNKPAQPTNSANENN